MYYDNTEDREDALEAIDTLLTSYRSGDNRENNICPLCNINVNTCELCPWVLIEDQTCGDTKNIDSYHDQSLSHRIIRLEKWKLLLEAEREKTS